MADGIDKAGDLLWVPGMAAWLGKGLCVNLPRYCDEPRDDTGDHDENRALGH